LVYELNFLYKFGTYPDNPQLVKGIEKAASVLDKKLESFDLNNLQISTYNKRYFGGYIDTIMMRLTDIAMAFPFLILIIFILSILGPGIQNIYIAVFLVAWTMYARLVRAEMLVEKNKDYIVAAQVLGFGSNRIIFKHAMPNIITSCIIFSMFDFVLNILLVSGLSFLGLGVQPPIPEWGAMVAEGRDFILTAWWIGTLPGFFILLTGFALCLIGDGLSERFGKRNQYTVSV
jgi:peptide/nickel transport system permease protein